MPERTLLSMHDARDPRTGDRRRPRSRQLLKNYVCLVEERVALRVRECDRED
jgi:hypothetical protein